MLRAPGGQNEPVRPQLRARLADNDCLGPASPGGASAWLAGNIVVDEARLQLGYHTWVRDDGESRPSWLTFGDRQQVGIEVAGTFDGELALDVATEIDFTITATDSGFPTLQRLRAFLRFGDAGDDVEVMDVALGGAPMQPGEIREVQGSLVPTRPAGVDERRRCSSRW